jgi:hypothetical protein
MSLLPMLLTLLAAGSLAVVAVLAYVVISLSRAAGLLASRTGQGGLEVMSWRQGPPARPARRRPARLILGPARPALAFARVRVRDPRH